MSNLRLRVSIEMYAGIVKACREHNLEIASFCRRVARQIINERITVSNVGKNKKSKSTTLYQIVSVDDWNFPSIKGNKLKAGIQVALDRLKNLPKQTEPVVTELAGIDYIIK